MRLQSSIFLVLASVLAEHADASLITSVSTASGAPFAVSVAGNDSSLENIRITASFSSGLAASCAWTNSECLNAGNFRITLLGDETNPIWTLSNLQMGRGSITSLTINALAGGFAFATCPDREDEDEDEGNPCWCDPETGWTVSSAPGGSRGSKAKARYGEPLYDPDEPRIGNLWGELVLNFQGRKMRGNQIFTFQAGTVLLDSGAGRDAAVPEPSTMMTIGLALLALSYARAAIRSSKSGNAPAKK